MISSMLLSWSVETMACMQTHSWNANEWIYEQQQKKRRIGSVCDEGNETTNFEWIKPFNRLRGGILQEIVEQIKLELI